MSPSLCKLFDAKLYFFLLFSGLHNFYHNLIYFRHFCRNFIKRLSFPLILSNFLFLLDTLSFFLLNFNVTKWKWGFIIMIPITGHTKLTCLLGSPVAHSISPMMHNTSFSALGLDYVYLALISMNRRLEMPSKP